MRILESSALASGSVSEGCRADGATLEALAVACNGEEKSLRWAFPPLSCHFVSQDDGSRGNGIVLSWTPVLPRFSSLALSHNSCAENEPFMPAAVSWPTPNLSYNPTFFDEVYIHKL